VDLLGAIVDQMSHQRPGRGVVRITTDHITCEERSRFKHFAGIDQLNAATK
jgi:hypothetical protein